MNQGARMALLVVGLAASGASAQAQGVEIGGGVGSVSSWWTGPFSGVHADVVMPIRDDQDLEALIAAQTRTSPDTLGFYAAVYRRRLGASRWARLEPFVTVGAGAYFASYDHHSTLSPPLLGFVGAGFDQRIAPRLKLRVDTQGILAAVIPVGVRVSAGLSVALRREPRTPRRIARR